MKTITKKRLVLLLFLLLVNLVTGGSYIVFSPEPPYSGSTFEW